MRGRGELGERGEGHAHGSLQQQRQSARQEKEQQCVGGWMQRKCRKHSRGDKQKYMQQDTHLEKAEILAAGKAAVGGGAETKA